MNETLLTPNSNLSFFTPGRTSYQMVTVSHHAIDGTQVALAIAGFSFLAYWYVRVTKDKAKYETWTNPNGRVVNLYKIVRRFFWAYTATVIILSVVQILLFRPPG